MQLPLPIGSPEDLFRQRKLLARTSFSHNQVNPQDARLALESRYLDLLEETHLFDRRLVSYQGNKNTTLHSWIKYREGFSAQLVEQLLDLMEIQPGAKILEPFSGSATTLLVARSAGMNAVGIEILPVCDLAWKAKSLVFDYDLGELNELLRMIDEEAPPSSDGKFPHLVITESAFDEHVEQQLLSYTNWFQHMEISAPSKTLLQLVLASILEEISFTRKDGQYLRWDSRAQKLKTRNEIRITQGKKPIKGLDKGSLPTVRSAILSALNSIVRDIAELQQRPKLKSTQQIIRGSALTVLPSLEAEQFDCVITSPPYCNRYDYTRTYALELAYLGVGEDGIRALRQSQLSCTVENRSKLDLLERTYKDVGRPDSYQRILSTIHQNEAFQEINQALQVRWDRGEINNRGILSMVEGYFTELAFVFAEILRTCKSGAPVAFVNDNVRYGGEIIPVDLLTTDIAESLGFIPEKVYVLPQRKGNSSQQMSRFGREALRKSITIWRKP